MHDGDFVKSVSISQPRLSGRKDGGAGDAAPQMRQRISDSEWPAPSRANPIIET